MSAGVIYLGEIRNTPIGTVSVAAGPRGLLRVDFIPAAEHQTTGLPLADLRARDSFPMLDEALRQIGEYLDGRRRDFDLPVDWSLFQPFQARALRACAAIPFGQVRTYGELAAEMGHPRAARAVGAAMAANPLPLLLPCHRVVGSDRCLHGYSAPGGLNTKAWLLRLEGHRVENLKLMDASERKS